MGGESKKALIVGSGGQDGHYLSDLLVRRGYRVEGVTRESLDIADEAAVHHLIGTTRPDEVYLLAAYHQSAESEVESDGELFRKSLAVHATATVNFLEGALRHAPDSRLFFASSSHIYSDSEGLLDEASPSRPTNIYAITKYAGMQACRYYREQKNLFASCGILFNHESNLRASHFLSRKIVLAAVQISRGLAGAVELGNLDAVVDWGYAPDYVDAMHRILQAPNPADYVVATGIPHTVRQFAELAFAAVNLDYRDYVKVRPGVLTKRIETRLGDAGRLQRDTGWKPTVDFEQMVALMVRHELANVAEHIEQH